MLSDAADRDVRRLNALAEEFDVSLPGRELIRVRTVGDLEAHLQAHSRRPLRDIRGRVASVLGQLPGAHPDQYLRPEARVFETDLRTVQPEAGSLLLQDLERIMVIEEEFGLEIPDETASRLADLSALRDFLASQLTPGLDHDELWRRMAHALARDENTGITVDASPSTPFVRCDLIAGGRGRSRSDS